MNLNLDKVPTALKSLPNWVLWKTVTRDGEPTKVPFTTAGNGAKANDATTWTTFDEVAEKFAAGKHTGIGFEFAVNDGLCGIDLDGCRDKISGKIADWARDIIRRLDSYAEISPSETGVKLFIRGKSPFETGRKKELPYDKICDKQPAIEVYDKLRYFAVTGWRLQGQSEPQERSEQLAEICAEIWTVEKANAPNFDSTTAVVERARKYVATMPPAVSQQGGHNATFRVACVLILGFGLDISQALPVLSEWNLACQPPWSERELMHKLKSASTQPGERNYLRGVTQERWTTVKIPEYKTHEKKPVEFTDLADAARKYANLIRGGDHSLVETGIKDLDYAIGGGLEMGEMVVIGAVSGHGKSAISLQMAHQWTKQGLPTLVVSEEMSSLMLGKRTLQFISDHPEWRWSEEVESLDESIADYQKGHARCLVVESVGTADAACEAIETAVLEHGVRCAVVDYAGMLRSKGNSRYEQVTNTSIALRQVATKHKLLLVVLAQLNRQIETRKEFIPVMGDLKETGQLGHDADVVLFCVWPYKVNGQGEKDKYQFFIGKNRNRETRQHAVTCRFDGNRQRVNREPVASFNADDHEYPGTF